MAAPSFVAASTGTTDATGAWTHTSAAPAAAGNVLIVHALQDGTAADISITSVTNAENLAGTDSVLTSIGEFAVGSAVAASQHLWIGRSLSTSAMVITGANAGGDDVYVRVYEFRDVNTGTTLAEVIENGTAGSTANSAGTGTTASDAAVTTLGTERLALQFIAANDDVLLTESFSGGTGGGYSWLEAVYSASGGTDGSILLNGGVQGFVHYIPSGFGSIAANINGESGTAGQQGQSFDSGAGGDVGAVVLLTTKSGTPTDDVIVEIQTNSGGLPSGSVVGSSGTINAADILTGEALTWFPVTATLSASTTYWIVARRSGARDLTNRVHLGGSSPGTYASGQAAETNTGVWTGNSNDTVFIVSGSSGGTIDGGTMTITSAAWGVCGFALIGTTAAGPADPVLNAPLTVLQAVNRASVW